jgi:hypothetical protein
VPNYNVAPETFQPVIRRSRENPRERESVLMAVVSCRRLPSAKTSSRPYQPSMPL